MAPKRIDYSALVELRLIVGSLVLPLAQLGPSFAILRDHVNLAPTSGKIEVIVDKRVSSVHQVYIPHGISAKRFEFF